MMRCNHSTVSFAPKAEFVFLHIIEEGTTLHFDQRFLGSLL